MCLLCSCAWWFCVGFGVVFGLIVCCLVLQACFVGFRFGCWSVGQFGSLGSFFLGLAWFSGFLVVGII